MIKSEIIILQDSDLIKNKVESLADFKIKRTDAHIYPVIMHIDNNGDFTILKNRYGKTTERKLTRWEHFLAIFR